MKPNLPCGVCFFQLGGKCFIERIWIGPAADLETCKSKPVFNVLKRGGRMEERCSKSRRESGGSCVSRDLTCLTRRDSLDRSFYGGGQRERGILWGAYLKLIRHVNSIYKVFDSTD